jgi:zinc metalloprotease ZmpB
MKRPSDRAVARAEKIEAPELARRLGISAQIAATGGQRQSLTVNRRQLVVYRLERAKVQRDGPAGPGKPAEGMATITSTLPRLPVPDPPARLQEGQHYVAAKVDFALRFRQLGLLNWVAILEVETLAVVYLRPFVDDVTGLIFDVEPATTNGGPLPRAASAVLNPVRVSSTLLGLNAPAAGVQSLTGDTIALIDSELPTIASPTEPTGTNFDFDARTDNFAAVNAYAHCDRFFRLTDGMGFTRAGFYGGTTFPTSVDHRGSITTTTGNEVNAHCLGTTGGAGILRTTFMLADTGDTTHPIGIACDYRVVLHELGGHGVLYNHVNSANFGFSHSAGDSVGIILNDPGSQAADRFLSFPWNSVVVRRHDRTPAAGWGWAGTIALNPFSGSDPGGYNNEQILATTMFRIYRSIGGDSTDLTTQRFAARMTVFLVFRAIATLTPATNPATAAGFATALMTADRLDWVSENITGGAYGKVIRWSFEKQGLFQPAGTPTPNNNPGAPPAVDVYIDDGRAGEYQFQPVFWNNQNVWNRRNADGGTTHEDPIVGRTNYAYVKVKNRGTQLATGVSVKGFHADPAVGLSYPNDWIPMTTAQLAAADVAANNVAEVVVGPFSWVPTHVGHECMLMVVSATGDASNLDNIALGDSIPDWRMVPNDNNIAQRNVSPVPGGGTSGLVEEFAGLEFRLRNPLAKVARMELRPQLPALLAERQWKLEFSNPGGRAFALSPGESRTIVMRLHAGAPFDAQDVAKAPDRAIHVFGHADGILVGGMSYELDPMLRHPTRRGPRGERHDRKALAAKLIEDLEVSRRRVEDVSIRRITIDVELEDEDDED